MLSSYYHVLLFYSLASLAYIAQAVLKSTNARFRGHSEERRRSIASIIPIIAAKSLIFFLALPAVCAAHLRPDSWDATLLERAQLCGHVLAITYLFDMTYRRVNTILWAHHTASIGAALFLILHTQSLSDEPHIVRIWLAVPLVFLGIGVGVTDLGGDVAVLVYYLAPQSLRSAAVVRACAKYLIVGRAFQWAVVLTFLVQGQWVQLGLGVWSGATACAVFLGWGCAELEEIWVMFGISEKLRKKVLDKLSSETAKS
ncbi:hypothetical protein C8J57DRAFT_1472686 [Mycena rebaudengoi]|nr:hypothetical protein C8J57DRAFT_1472686 [Mycena rebaudengoi]